MGGVWVSVGSHADIRIAVTGALIGFSGPRAVAAMTGRELADGANTAEAAYAAGLVDALVDPADVAQTVGRALQALRPDLPQPAVAVPAGQPPACDGWDHVVASRNEPRPTGRELIEDLLADPFLLRAADDTVAAAVGRLLGRRVLAVALAADRSTMPTPAGFGLLRRVAELAGGLDLALVCLVDTPGADPHLESAGLSPAIADAMAAVLGADAPTVSLVHGEGGSGGALAAAVTDVVGVGRYGWFAALSPEGAAATLRIDPPEAARVMRITPVDLIADGFADAAVPVGAEREWLAASVDGLRALPVPERRHSRHERWSGVLRPR
jgi:acetyl-CoA carboxylase carboxyl transferase subunit beta